MGTKFPEGDAASPKSLADIYGSDSAWLLSMSQYTPIFYDGFAKLALSILREGAIPRKIKELILACVYVYQGFTDGAVLHMKNAIQLGTLDEEIGEMLAALVLSRGPRSYFEGIKIWRAAGGNPERGSMPKPSGGNSLDKKDMLKYFEDYYGSTLPHIRALFETGHLDVLEGYYQMRKYCIADMVLSRKYKEFLYVAVNAADMRPEAIELHVKGAYDSGVTKEEVLEAMLLGIMAGGVASWLYASKVYESTAR